MLQPPKRLTPRIRPFRDTDADVVAGLVRRCLREVNSRDYSAEVIDTMCEHYAAARFPVLARERHVCVADTPDGVVGTVTRDGDFAYTMFVDPTHSGRGVGRRLMDHIEQEAHADGYPQMRTNASITAREFYLRLGYREVSRTDGPHGPTHRMHKPLG